MIFGDDTSTVQKLLTGRRQWLTPRVIRWIAIGVLAVALGAFLMHPTGQRATAAFGRRVRLELGMAKADLAGGRERLAATTSMPLDQLVEKSRIVIYKADRKLELRSGDELIKTYKIGLGTHPEGRKERRGDAATPEGEYYICTRLTESPYHLFMGISYPNAEDARRGMEAGIIDDIQCRAIEDSIGQGVQPPWETDLGGAIGIHGAGSSSDWTLGCIAVDNSAIEELWVATRMGTPVTIQP
jgi:hypothetical protein